MNAAAGAVDPDTNAQLITEDHKRHGYVILTVDADTISGTMTATDPVNAAPTPNVDTFKYPAKAMFLPDGAVISL